MLAGREADHDNRFATGIEEMPWAVIDRNMDVTVVWRNVERRRSKDRYNAHILRSILDEHSAARERLGQGRIDDQSPWQLVSDRDQC